MEERLNHAEMQDRIKQHRDGVIDVDYCTQNNLLVYGCNEFVMKTDFSSKGKVLFARGDVVSVNTGTNNGTINYCVRKYLKGVDSYPVYFSDYGYPFDFVIKYCVLGG